MQQVKKQSKSEISNKFDYKSKGFEPCAAY